MNRAGRSLVAFLSALSALQTASGLGPHETALLVNAASPRSLEVANHYLQFRRIPPENVVFLDLPEQVLDPAATVTREEFTRLIWEPARRTLRERQVDDHILAWAYAPDFPVRVAGDPELSLMGLTLLRNQVPDAEAIRTGQAGSLLFAGPGQDGVRQAPTRSLIQYFARLQTNTPLPSILLAHTGSRGLTVSEAVESLRTATQADSTRPDGEVLFLDGSDVRVQARQWQFDGAVRALQALGVKARVAAEPPGPPRRLLGVLAGQADPVPSQMGVLVPGSFADHLTSYAAAFAWDQQTKLTTWLRAGAAASAGTVTEPMAIWTKFPHARLYAHYAAGCSLLEAFFQAAASPMQLQLVGEPLCRPWGQPPGVTLVNLGEEGRPLSGRSEFLASSWSAAQGSPPITVFLLDGRLMPTPGNRPQIAFDTSMLEDGYHELRAVAFTQGEVRQQGFDVAGFESRNKDRSVQLRGPAAGSDIDLNHPLDVTVNASGDPLEIGLMDYGRVLIRQPTASGSSLRLDPRRIGAGPHRLQAAAWYEDGGPVRSAPVPVRVTRKNEAPALKAGRWAPGADGRWLATVEASDADGDPVVVEWAEVLDGTAPGWTVTGGRCDPVDEALDLQGSNGIVLAWAPGTPTAVQAVRARISVPGPETATSRHLAAVAFNVRDAANFMYFGWRGTDSSWEMGVSEAGVLRRLHAIGAPLRPDRWHQLEVRFHANGELHASVDDEVLFRRSGSPSTGGVGLLAAEQPVRAEALCVAPPRADLRVTEDGSSASLGDGDRRDALRVILRDPAASRVARPAEPAPAQ